MRRAALAEAVAGVAGQDLAALERRMLELESELAEARRAITALTERLATGNGRASPVAPPAAAPVVVPPPADGAGAVETEAELRRQNAELDRLNRMKSDFISIAAHEFRTPMTSIVGYLDLITQGRLGEVPEAMKRPIASLNRNTQRLKHLIEDMLDVSRLDSGRMVLHRSARDLGDLARSALAELETFARAKGQTVETAFADVPPVDVDADRTLQVITALLANAVKYAPDQGCITLSVARSGEWAVLKVRAHGIGIPAEARDKIFEPFSEITAPQFHSSAGPDSAGLGLYIARGIVELHGGEISVDSRDQEYTEFSVRLPLAAPAGSDADSA